MFLLDLCGEKITKKGVCSFIWKSGRVDSLGSHIRCGISFGVHDVVVLFKDKSQVRTDIWCLCFFHSGRTTRMGLESWIWC